MKEHIVEFLDASAEAIGGFPINAVHALATIGKPSEIETIENLAADVINKYERLPRNKFLSTPEYSQLAKIMRDVNARHGSILAKEHPLIKKKDRIHENSRKRNIASKGSI